MSGKHEKKSAGRRGPVRAKRPVPTRASHEQLAREVAEWTSGARSPGEFRDAPEAVPRAAESTAISLRMPKDLLALLRAFAQREGVGYQVLLKRWIDDRLRVERERLRAARRADEDAAEQGRPRAPAFPIVDRREDEPTHYQVRGL